jgi:hypothetical protein
VAAEIERAWIVIHDSIEEIVEALQHKHIQVHQDDH